MTRKQNNIIRLYALNYILKESPLERQGPTLAKIDLMLSDLSMPIASKVIYDNEGAPKINWQQFGFYITDEEYLNIVSQFIDDYDAEFPNEDSPEEYQSLLRRTLLTL